MRHYDVIIIGGGIIGCAVARCLARYDLRTALCEASSDIGSGTTKANGGIIHSGYDPKPGTLKAKLNARGNQLYSEWSKQLGFRFKRTGSMVLGFSPSDRSYLEQLLKQGKENGVDGLQIIEGKRIHQLEPQANENACIALYCPHTGIVDPFEVAIACAENATANGTEFYLNSPVIAIKSHENGFEVCTPQETLYSKYIINAAGCHADDVARLAGDDSFNIVTRHGDILIFDKDCGVKNLMTLYPIPSPETKGVVVISTLAGNVLTGSSAVMRPKDDNDSYAEGIDQLLKGVSKLVPSINLRKVIRPFAGERAVWEGGNNDFYIRPSEKVHGLVHVAGIQSPGVASAPAIGEYTVQLLAECGLTLSPRSNYIATRQTPIDFSECSTEEKAELISRDPRFGHIVCRCETVTEAEIVDAIHRIPGATTIDGVKRRTRAGMGRCQGGFCQSRVVSILCRELGLSPEEILLENQGSNLLFGHVKEGT